MKKLSIKSENIVGGGMGTLCFLSPFLFFGTVGSAANVTAQTIVGYCWNS